MTRKRANAIVRGMIKVNAELQEIATATLLEIDSTYRRTITQDMVDRIEENQINKIKGW